MSRCHHRPDRSAPSSTASLFPSVGGGPRSGSSRPRGAARRPLALRIEDFDSLGVHEGAADLLQRIEGWANGVVERLRRLEVYVSSRLTSDGQVRQVRFVNEGTVNEEAAGLMLRVDTTEVRAGLELPATEARQARTRLADPARALELSASLETLPEQFTLSASGDDEPAKAERASADDIRALLDRIERDRTSMWIGWNVPRELAIRHAALLDEQLEDAIVALAQVFVLLAGNSRVETTGQKEEDDSLRARRFASRNAKNGGDRADDDRVRTASGTRKEHVDRGRTAHPRGRERDRDREGDGDDIESPDPIADAPAPRGRGWGAKIPPRPTMRGGRSSKNARVVIERGSRVRVLKGPFSGKVGVVHELDGKGSARVMLGLLAVRLEVDNLLPSAVGRGRPVLSTSHRKPTPER